VKALRIGTALLLCAGTVIGACATGESEVGGNSGYTGVGGGKGGTDAGVGGATGGAGGAQTGGFGNGGALGGGAGAGAVGGTAGDGGTGLTGGTGATGGSSGGSGGSGATGGGGGSTGGTGGSTGGNGGSTGGTGGGSTGGNGGSTGGSGGSGGTVNMIPTNCAQTHGVTGCCGPNNNNYYWACGQLNVITCPGGTCGWNATGGWYDCGFTGVDPSGVNPRECGLPNPQPTQCPGVACCSASICGSPLPSPAGCYCDSLCVISGDCCLNACSVCGAC
jgi:hypothetical protein